MLAFATRTDGQDGAGSDTRGHGEAIGRLGLDGRMPDNDPGDGEADQRRMA